MKFFILRIKGTGLYVESTTPDESGRPTLTNDIEKAINIKASALDEIIAKISAYKSDNFQCIDSNMLSYYKTSPKLHSMPNGFVNWLETYYEVVGAIMLEISKDIPTGIVKEILDSQGSKGFYDFAEELTNKFEKEFEGYNWGTDAEFLEEIEKFLEKELKN